MCNKVYDIIDLAFNASVICNPFCDVDFYAVVEGENYKKTVQGFYNGNDEFLIRLNFDKAGEYTYTTYSNITELNAQTGTVSVEENTDKNKHGAIVLSEENKSKLFYQDGTHYNLCSFECDWLFAVSYDDKENLTKTKKLIDTLVENKFNQVVMNVYAYDLRWNMPEWELDPKIKPEHNHSARNDIFPFGGSNIDPDYTTLNVDFFKHLDNVISLLDENNIVSHLMIYVWNKEVNWPDGNSKWDNMYFDYVVKRYGAYSNILWDISKEALGHGHTDMNYIVDRIIRLKHIDAYERLVTVHDAGFCMTFPKLVDIISAQIWVKDIYNAMKKITQKFPDKVVFNIEHGGYEEGPYQIFTGNYTNPLTCLLRNYEIIFAGSYSSYYWQPLSWSVTMMPWESDKGPYLNYYKNMITLFEEQRFEELHPADLGSGGYFLANNELTHMLAFIPKENYRIGMAGSKVPKGKKCKYKYFNIITGEYSKEEEMILNAPNRFISPFEDDTVVIVDVVE